MSLRTFRVDFDRSNATFVTGETVSGRIILDIAKEKMVRGLFFTAIGRAYVHWTETAPVNSPRRNSVTNQIHYSDSEEYFSFRYNVVGTQKFDSRVKISSGHHEYPFSFQLPNNIPCSFEHRNGHIRYTVKAVIDRPWKFDHECKSAFTVLASSNLNHFRERCIGIDDEVIKKFYFCCCCDNGTLNVRIRLPISGYVPGQTINTTLDYKNHSSDVQITKITTTLERELTFRASSNKTREIAEVTSVKLSSPFPNHGQSIAKLLVPPIPPSNLEFCSIIDLEYKLVVAVHVTGMHVKITRSYPILIGTIPLYSLMGQDPMAMTIQPTAPYVHPDGTEVQIDPSYVPRLSIGFIHPDQPRSSSANSDIPPPSYQECVSKAEHIRDQDESDYVMGANISFAPRYPVFNYPAPSIHHK